MSNAKLRIKLAQSEISCRLGHWMKIRIAITVVMQLEVFKENSRQHKRLSRRSNSRLTLLMHLNLLTYPCSDLENATWKKSKKEMLLVEHKCHSTALSQ